MKDSNGRYRKLWQDSVSQPFVPGPQDDYWYQRVGRYVRAIACEATAPFPVPVGVTAAVSGMSPECVAYYVRELVRNEVLRVVQPGAPGRYTRYAYTRPAPVRRCPIVW